LNVPAIVLTGEALNGLEIAHAETALKRSELFVMQVQRITTEQVGNNHK